MKKVNNLIEKLTKELELKAREHRMSIEDLIDKANQQVEKTNEYTDVLTIAGQIEVLKRLGCQ